MEQKLKEAEKHKLENTRLKVEHNHLEMEARKKITQLKDSLYSLSPEKKNVSGGSSSRLNSNRQQSDRDA